jgi:hypothetical protein
MSSSESLFLQNKIYPLQLKTKILVDIGSDNLALQRTTNKRSPKKTVASLIHKIGTDLSWHAVCVRGILHMLTRLSFTSRPEMHISCAYFIRTTQLTSTPFGRVVHNSEETISHFLYFSLKFKGAQIKAEPTKDGAKGTHESLMIVDSYIHKCWRINL